MSKVRVQCGTWNVNGHLPTPSAVHGWLNAPSSSSSAPSAPSCAPPHIVSLSLQELVNLKDLKHYVKEDQSKARIHVWARAVISSLQLQHRVQYSLVALDNMVGTGLLVVCQTQLLLHVRHIAQSHVATGKFGVIGNKGGCAVRFSFMDRFTFCFIGVHLCAHHEHTARRNADWENVLTKLSFSSKQHQHQQRTIDGDGNPGGELDMRAMDHDLVFAMGDFNYRIDLEDDRALVLDCIKRQDYAHLLSRDQLLNELRNAQQQGGAFEGFADAAPITFPPTFKFRIGTVDTYVAKRVPAWCDRVLVNSNPLLTSIHSVQCAAYQSCANVVQSDHKPVRASFDIFLLLQPAAAPPKQGRSRSIVFFPEMEHNSPTATPPRLVEEALTHAPKYEKKKTSGGLGDDDDEDEEGQGGALVAPLDQLSSPRLVRAAAAAVLATPSHLVRGLAVTNPVDFASPTHFGLSSMVRCSSFGEEDVVVAIDDEEDDDDDEDDEEEEEEDVSDDGGQHHVKRFTSSSCPPLPLPPQDDVNIASANTTKPHRRRLSDLGFLPVVSLASKVLHHATAASSTSSSVAGDDGDGDNAGLVPPPPPPHKKAST